MIYGRPIAHVLLLHSGTFDAVVLDELLRAYEEKGVRWITLDEALEDPAYLEDVRVPGPGGTLLTEDEASVGQRLSVSGDLRSLFASSSLSVSVPCIQVK